MKELFHVSETVDSAKQKLHAVGLAVQSYINRSPLLRATIDMLKQPEIQTAIAHIGGTVAAARLPENYKAKTHKIHSIASPTVRYGSPLATTIADNLRKQGSEQAQSKAEMVQAAVRIANLAVAFLSPIAANYQQKQTQFA